MLKEEQKKFAIRHAIANSQEETSGAGKIGTTMKRSNSSQGPQVTGNWQLIGRLQRW